MGKTIGNCAYLWAFDGGAGTEVLPDIDVTAITIESFSEEVTPEFETEATDDEGNVAAVRRGPLKVTFNMSGYAKANASLMTYTAGSRCKLSARSVELNKNLTCYVEKFAINASNNDFMKVELTAIGYETLPSVCCPS